jgi:hypothetical protein
MFLPNDFSKMYDDSTKMFAFKSTLLLVNGSNVNDTLYAFEAFKRKVVGASKPIANTANSKTETRLRYTTNLDNGSQDLLSPLELRFLRPLKSMD